MSHCREDVGSEVFPGMRPDCLYFSADMITFTITGMCVVCLSLCLSVCVECA